MKGARKQGFKKPQNTKKTFKRILKYLDCYRIAFILVIICLICSALCQTVATFLLKDLINKAIIPFIGETGPHIYDELIAVVLKMLLFYFLSILCTFTYSQIIVTVSTGTLRRVRDDLFEHVEKLPIRFFDTHPHGEIMSSFTNDTDTLREMISNGIPTLISSTVSVVSVFVMMCVLSIPLTILVILSLIINLQVIKFISSRSRKNFIAQQKQIATVNGYIEEMIEGQKVIKVFNHQGIVNNDFNKINTELCNISTKAQAYMFLLFPIMGNLSHIHYVITAIIGASMILGQSAIINTFGANSFMAYLLAMDVGSLISFLSFTKSFSQPITQLSQQFTSVLTALAGAERIFNIIDQEPEVDDGYVKLVNCEIDENGNIKEVNHHTNHWAWKHPHQDGTVSYRELKGDMVFENIVFGYDPNKIVLKDVSLYAKPGQKIAFVGSTGAGKTTITNLINRFYNLNEGKIRYDGINIQKIKLADLRKSLSMVLQDTHLFTGTVMENIRYGRLEATDEECIRAAKLANADQFIMHLPNGYQTMLTSDGTNLSQGQRQLLAIARAAVADPPILILDEATSSIDTRTEHLIELGMDKLMENRTTFVIAHRLSTVRNSNAIMVLENGKIIERGDHKDLISQKGKYYQLYTGAFELE